MGDVPNAPKLENFSKRQRIFIEWLATPKYGRIPPTQEMLADELGLNRHTLSRWKKLPGLLDAAVSRARSMIHDNLPEIYGALNREAAKGSFQHIKLALEVTGEYVDTSKVDMTTKGESLNDRHPDESRADAMVSILDAFRTELLRPNRGGNGSMAAEEQAAGGGVIPSGR